jgi:flagellar biogenesis protein FliO
MRRTAPIKGLHRGLAAMLAVVAPVAMARLSAGGPAPEVDLVRLVPALLLCLVLAVAIILVLRRRLPGHRNSTAANAVRIVESMRLGARGELHVIDFGGRRILLAADPNGIVPVIDVPAGGATVDATAEPPK